SLTKLMTALVFLETEPNWEETVSVGSCGQFAYGKIKTKDIFSAALIASDNCAARELARQTGLNEVDFAQAMNQKAKSLGLSKTNFSDPTGLDAKNISTALEVAKILREILDWPKARNAASQFYYEFSSSAGKHYYAKSTDDLLWSFIHKYPYEIVGGKTGTLGEAGYCLALAVEKDGNEVIVVTLNNKSDYLRFQDAKSLTHWAFNTYEWPEKND
ncbi:serine hydrolase, partial [Patescibacteria group bacterium]|nr:serine hydrolase [Patescibacteria group bacterium]